MENEFDSIRRLVNDPKVWLVTGAAGFIGSHIVECLLRTGQTVIGLDNFATGSRENLAEIQRMLREEQWKRFSFVEGDIRNLRDIETCMSGVDVVLHQAALGSVPRSIKDPITSTEVNVLGFVNVLTAARSAGVSRFVYASSSSVYGSSPHLPKREEFIGAPLSPYAATKRTDELFAEVFAHLESMHCIGLRYFNVFGPRQSPNGPYAAVIPRWILALLNGQQCKVFGDGDTSRDFCYVDNVVLANLLAGSVPLHEPFSRLYNVCLGGQTSLVELHSHICDALSELGRSVKSREPDFLEFRAGDVRHSRGDFSRIAADLGFCPVVGVEEGIQRTVTWFSSNSGQT